MTRWENTSVYRALGTLSALPVRALSRLPLKAGKRRFIPLTVSKFVKRISRLRLWIRREAVMHNCSKSDSR